MWVLHYILQPIQSYVKQKCLIKWLSLGYGNIRCLGLIIETAYQVLIEHNDDKQFWACLGLFIQIVYLIFTYVSLGTLEDIYALRMTLCVCIPPVRAHALMALMQFIK